MHLKLLSPSQVPNQLNALKVNLKLNAELTTTVALKIKETAIHRKQISLKITIAETAEIDYR